MAQINKPTDYFNTVLYTGNGSTQSITGVGFQPDWTWIKSRSNATNHQAVDSVRGNTKALFTDLTNAEATYTQGITSFDSDGFSLGNLAGYNGSSYTFASWNWLAGGTASSNTDGSITSSVSASTTSGFSIVSYTGTGVNATVGHGLGVAPKMIILKNRDDGTANWVVGHGDIGWGNILFLNATDASTAGGTTFQSTAPTSSVFSIGTSGRINDSGEAVIAYCFAEKKGFSKFGSYIGNNSTDGTFVYTGFKPAWILIKNVTTGGTHWRLADTKRTPFNTTQNLLFPSTNAAENTTATGTGNDFQIFSNGFKLTTTGNIYANESGSTFIYMCFAEQPLVGTNNIPATAR